MGAPRYLKVCLMSMICSVADLAATNSEPYVAVSTVAWFLEYQSAGVLLTKWRHPVEDLPVAKQWFKLASMVMVVVTALPSGSGMSSVLIPNRDSPNGYSTVMPAELQSVTLSH